MMVQYYSQRATAAFIVTECTMVSNGARGYPRCPGLFSDAQVLSWTSVVDAVHTQRTPIFAQLWHAGRQSHPSLLDGDLPVAPSPIPIPGFVSRRVDRGRRYEHVTPRELTKAEIASIVESFASAAWRAVNAKFDGIELHAAFGYLIDQFLQEATNQRSDEYGGTPANRARFLMEILEAVFTCIPGPRWSHPLSSKHVGRNENSWKI
jgi:N-ethylmaleimide reductase